MSIYRHVFRPSRCLRCGRLHSLFGNLRGVCTVCAVRRSREIVAMVALKVLPQCCLTDCVERVTDYCYQGLKLTIARAARNYWHRCLLGRGCEPRVWTEDFTQTRLTNEEDETEEGCLKSSLHFVNPMWKLAVCDGAHRALDIVLDMLPPPSWK